MNYVIDSFLVWKILLVFFVGRVRRRLEETKWNIEIKKFWGNWF